MSKVTGSITYDYVGSRPPEERDAFFAKYRRVIADDSKQCFFVEDLAPTPPNASRSRN